MSVRTQPVFLSAEWRDLVMLNYEIAPRLLERYVPGGTELDSHSGKTYVSVVGFKFMNTRMFGKIGIPFHRNFLEVNLRFYVRREAVGEVRRGVVFISEVVPKTAIAATARLVYGEKYRRLRMRHRSATERNIAGTKSLSYQWKLGTSWCSVSAEGRGSPQTPEEGSLSQFITEHYWGYSKGKSNKVLEYRVEHVPWKVWEAEEAGLTGEMSALYGADLAAVLKERPDSAFIAEGSSVLVRRAQSVI